MKNLLLCTLLLSCSQLSFSMDIRTIIDSTKFPSGKKSVFLTLAQAERLTRSDDTTTNSANIRKLEFLSSKIRHISSLLDDEEKPSINFCQQAEQNVNKKIREIAPEGYAPKKTYLAR